MFDDKPNWLQRHPKITGFLLVAWLAIALYPLFAGAFE